MSRPGRPPIFKLNKAPLAIAAKKLQQSGGFRGSPRERGYDARWDRLSIAFRKKNPFCLFCEQKGRTTLTDLVDHMIPVVDSPKLKHEWSNLCALCRPCHGRKFSMETYARDNDLLEMLPTWCKDPEKRPTHFV